MAELKMISLESLLEFQANNKSTRTTNWTELGSKKTLREAKILTDAQVEELSKIVGTFSFSVHSSKKWVVVTLYSAKTKAYKFMAVDLSNMMIAPMDSIKNAKKWVEEQVALETKEETEKSEETVEDAVEETSGETTDNAVESAEETVETEAKADVAEESKEEATDDVHSEKKTSKRGSSK